MLNLFVGVLMNTSGWPGTSSEKRIGKLDRIEVALVTACERAGGIHNLGIIEVARGWVASQFS